MYLVHVTPSEKQKIGTVNNCNCNFFNKHHSSCKHMFVVARRTRFRISERVKPCHTQTTNILPEPDSQRSNSATSNNVQFQDRTTSPQSPTPNLALQQPLHSTPIENNPPLPSTSLPPIPSSNASNSILTPNYSVRLYLEMCGGQTRADSARALSWANQLQGSGLLQSNPLRHRKHNRTNDNQRALPTGSPILTPADPAAVPAEELDVYWDHPG